ncbi:GNAT family N-acetyltransferase [uncultured Sunxiuqinia sp.]|uniref:GNAT family N-acetyltransferase n=1 Tax=uncultured Sunxiuqinia sp. TaxID=1573825 RepID=UPI002AA7FD1F|nr:GNAT family N-acetyltransferase [uncultured Sunxiuqinia sp.]
MNLSFVVVDLSKELHQKQLIRLLDSYMRDEMGNNAPMSEELAPKILDGLKSYSGYLGFFALVDGEFAALANCNKNFSTFKAKPLINIHDFVVHPDFRGKGVGRFLLDAIAGYGKDNGFCRVNLEVRHDNEKAQRLYQKASFNECQPPMYFLERLV